MFLFWVVCFVGVFHQYSDLLTILTTNTLTEGHLAMDLDNRTSVGPTVKSLVSPATLNVFLLVNNLTLCCTLSAFGIFTNLVNIIVYCKMGFSENINAKFCALSVFDFLLSLFTLITKLFYSRVVGGRNLAASQITTLPRFVAACGSNMMTALISAERCVCVLFPLKVMSIIITTQCSFNLP